jgi:ubiquitin-like protein Nedd8
MKIKVKTLIGKDMEIKLEPNATVLDLKLEIESKEKITPQQQKLVYNGRVLNDDGELLKNQNLQNNSVVHMVIALRGG